MASSRLLEHRQLGNRLFAPHGLRASCHGADRNWGTSGHVPFQEFPGLVVCQSFDLVCCRPLLYVLYLYADTVVRMSASYRVRLGGIRGLMLNARAYHRRGWIQVHWDDADLHLPDVPGVYNLLPRAYRQSPCYIDSDPFHDSSYRYYAPDSHRRCTRLMPLMGIRTTLRR